ncbi:MAG: ASKHA domain-containing protein [Candidatus Limivivens sp.]|nr:ASKHA domain-containing protein [Candidatus Limivivens sp.]
MGTSITIEEAGGSRKITCQAGESILDALIRNEIYVSAACGGKGKCGKCKIQLLAGSLPVTPGDQKKLKTEELESGVRLSCLAFPKEDCRIRLQVQKDEEFDILSEEIEEKQMTEESGYAVAIDIGTTTLAMVLVGLDSGKTLKSYSAINRQRAYGADVISRIQASNDGKKEELRKSIQEDLQKGVRVLMNQGGLKPEQIRKVAIGGNTTMGHLLMGFSCENLGVYPFRPVDIGTISGSFAQIIGSMEGAPECPVILLPGISTYVGGDILSGLLACGFAESEETCLLVDLGTNGEMAIGKKDRILVTSTAAGPAFEGGNISCGMGSVAGAICNVDLSGGGVHVRTIGGKAPIGLCGTGVIETVSELVKEDYVDDTGRLEEPYFEQGFELARTPEGQPICFTQKDVREIQLAKSAVRAGIETLLKRFGASYSDISRVYLAGGFGFHMDQQKAVSIGLLPSGLADRLETVGNSSLSGAIRYLLDEDAPAQAEQILEAASEVELSTDSAFNEFYMEYMYFE